MKIELERKVEYFEVNPGFCITLASLFRRLQECAVRHSEQAGFGTKNLIQSGRAWVLNRIGVTILKSPRYLEALKVVTWHRETAGFRSYRDFEVFSGDEKVAEASSLWIFADLETRKIMPAPKNTADAYTAENDKVEGLHIESWRPDIKFSPSFTTEITMRSSDFDPLGHVNSAVYFDYIETLLYSYYNDPPEVKTIRIQFSKEMGMGVQSINAGLKTSDNSCLFRLYNQDTIFASGNLEFHT